MTREIRVETNQRGAGLYGAPAPTHVTRCVNSKNPVGHSSECPCRVIEKRIKALVAAGATEAKARAWVKGRYA